MSDEWGAKMKEYYCVESRYDEEGKMLTSKMIGAKQAEKCPKLVRVETNKWDIYFDWFEDFNVAKKFAKDMDT